MSNTGEKEVICILGMHRSGTSVVSRLVNLHDFNTGPPEKLLPPHSDNPNGYWEYRPFVDINDQILTRLGGTWHEPPDFTPGWETAAEFADLRRQARALVELDFSEGDWGWKDPRTCLTLPFWRALLPPQRYVICLRNPADVAKSLARRDNFPFAKSFNLWHRYVKSSLDYSADRPTLFMFYEDLLHKPVEEVHRLANFIERPPVDQAVFQDFLEADLHHHRTSFLDAVDEPEFAFPAKALYVALRFFVNERRKDTDATSVLSPEARQIWPLFSRCSYKAQVEADELGQRETALVEALKTEQERSAEALNQLREYQRRLADREGEIASREALIGTLRSDLEEKIAGYGQLEKALGLLQSRLSSLSEELRLANYGNLVGRVRKDVTRILPPGAKVIVISKGDSELLELEARTGWHFPRGEDGGYSGYYPADSAEAIRQLESLCGDGGEFLVIPSTAFWWLEHYDRFTYYLDTHFQRIWKNEDCLIYQLSKMEWSILARSASDRPMSNGTCDVAGANPRQHSVAVPCLAANAHRLEYQTGRTTEARMDADTYRRLVRRVRNIANSVLPRAATVIVISKGDEELLRLDGRLAWHYPQAEDGGYAGHYPADSGEAILQLGLLQRCGGQFLLIPSTAAWWLDHYTGLRRHLDEHAVQIWKDQDCSIYRFTASAAPLPDKKNQQRRPPGETKTPAGPVIDPAILSQRPLEPYEAWLEVNRWTPRRAADLRLRLADLRTLPLFSIAMPVYNPPLQFLEKAIESVHIQVYEHLELCIADDASTDPEVQRVLRDWASRDPRIRVCFRTENGNISRATNSAVDLAEGQFIVFMDHDDELEPDALGEVALHLSEHPEMDIVYTDDDKIDENGRRFDPQFKPDWSPELLLSYMYLSHLFVIRSSLYRRLGGLRVGFEGAQDYDLALRATEQTDWVGHIPKVLYHWRAIPGSTASSGTEKPHSFQAGLTAVQEALDRRGVKALAVQPSWAVAAKCGIFSHLFPNEGPRVAILIPTRDNHHTLRVCLESIKKTSYTNYEVVIVDNESENPEALQYLRVQPHRILRIASPDGKFNYAAINNQAANQLDAELILFLNDDTEIVSPCWLSQMVGYLQLSGVGAVGARLLYQNGAIQHAGVVHGYFNGLAGHAFRNTASHDNGYLSYPRVVRNYSAVTAACMLTRRHTFLGLGGFDEKAFAVAYNDVDFCHRLNQQGLRVVYCPTAELIHHEGRSRGFADDPLEPANYLKKYGSQVDKYYNVNLSIDDESFQIGSRTSEPGRKGCVPALMCSHNLNWEGAPYQQYELAAWLKKHGIVEPLVYSPSDGPLRREYEKKGIRVEVFKHPLGGVRDIRAYESAIGRFADFLRENQIELIHANTLETFFAMDGARHAHLPSIWNIHESQPWQTYFSAYGPDIATRALMCFSYPFKVVFVANATRRAYLPLDTHRNFATIHNGLDRDRLEKALNCWPRDAARRHLQVPEGAITILALGTVCERKGQLDLVEAVAHLADEWAAHVQCLIVGDRPGAYSTRLHAAQQALERTRRSRVHIIPETVETALYYSAADLFVCSSRIESFPRVILEAMACRLPIITTPVFGIVEQVRPNINGLFYQPGDVGALANTIERLLKDPDLRRRLAEKSIPVLETINDYDTMASAYARLFRQAWLSGGPRQRHGTARQMAATR